MTSTSSCCREPKACVSAQACPGIRTSRCRSAILFSPTYLEQHEAALNSPERFADLLDEPIPADYLLTRISDRILLRHALGHPALGLLDADQHYALFSRPPYNYPVASRLLRNPQCVDRSDLAAIEAELEAWRSSETALPVRLQRTRGMPLTASILTAAFRYLHAERGTNLHELLSPHVQIHPEVALAMARMALAGGDPGSAVQLFAMIAPAYTDAGDALSYAVALRSTGDVGAAQQRLVEVLRRGIDASGAALAVEALQDPENDQAWAALASSVMDIQACGEGA